MSIRWVLALAVVAALQAKSEGAAMLLGTGFEQGLPGWRQQGEADFGVDTAERRGGKQSARITVSADTPAKYQQLQYDVPDVREGDEFRAEVWVRTRGVSDLTGAYAVLEFLNAGGERVGIVHSRVGVDVGSKAWERLPLSGAAPAGASVLRFGLILHAHGTAWFDDAELVRTGRREEWPDLGGAPRTVTVRTDRVVHPRFGGVGFHAFFPAFDIADEHVEQVVAKRWRELRPAFARVTDHWDWDRAKFDAVARHLLRMKDVGTEVYLTTWNPRDTKPGPDRAAYARRVVDNLEYLIRERGCTNIRTYCMTNELSLGGWGTLRGDLPKFQDYHRELHRELQARKLDVQLLASDASPVGSWNTIEWAAKHMDDITGAYGGHHYFNRYGPDDERFYPWFAERVAWGAGIARARGKNFIIGEFGCKQDGRVRDGVRMDACIYWGTPLEPVVAIQLAEAVLAAINGSAYAMGNWTFMDFPDDYSRTYANKWGTFKWSGTDHGTRPHYYAYGLLTRFFRGPATVYGVESQDPRLRVAVVQHHDAGTWSIAVVNRNGTDVPLKLALDGQALDATFRKYVYDPASPPSHPFGDMQPPTARVDMRKGQLADTIGPGTLTVYTTAYDEEPPATVRGVKTGTSDGHVRVSWQASAEPDLCYYRVFRDGTQIGSTIAAEFTDRSGRTGRYAVTAVDQSGNASPVE